VGLVSLETKHGADLSSVAALSKSGTTFRSRASKPSRATPPTSPSQSSTLPSPYLSQALKTARSRFGIRARTDSRTRLTMAWNEHGVSPTRARGTMSPSVLMRELSWSRFVLVALFDWRGHWLTELACS
jgi:uncharacterized protein (DUF1800 family)